MRSVIVTPPSIQPIDRDALADLHLKVDYSVDDNLIDLQIKAATQYVEQLTGQSLITQTRSVSLDYFPLCDTITLPNGPLQSVTSIKYQDEDDNEQTLSSSEYWVDTSSRRIVVKDTWPVTKDRPGAVTITYLAGFGASADSVPSPLREAVLIVTGWMYTNRDQPVPHDLVLPLIGTYVVVQDAFY